MKDFVSWHSAEPRPPISRAVVQQYWNVLESASLAASSINPRLSAIRKLAAEAAENGLLDRSVAQGIVSLKGVRHSGDRAGDWLSREQARDLLAQPQIETTEEKRDCAILAVLLGCALRRSELAALDCRHIQQRDGRWAGNLAVEYSTAANPATGTEYLTDDPLGSTRLVTDSSGKRSLSRATRWLISILLPSRLNTLTLLEQCFATCQF